MTEILGITSYKQEDHLLGLVWVTILGLVFELFWWWLIGPICIFKSVGFIICSATFLNSLHIGIKYEHWELLSHKNSIHWLPYKSSQRLHCSKGHTLQNLNYFTNIFVFGPLNLLFFIKCNWNRFSIAWPTRPNAGLPIVPIGSKVMADCHVLTAHHLNFLVGLHSII